MPIVSITPFKSLPPHSTPTKKKHTHTQRMNGSVVRHRECFYILFLEIQNWFLFLASPFESSKRRRSHEKRGIECKNYIGFYI